MPAVSSLADRRAGPCTPVSFDHLRKAFYGVIHRARGEDTDDLLRIIPSVVVEFCDTEEISEAYSLAGRIIGLVRILSSPLGCLLARVTGGVDDLERAVEAASYLPLSSDLRFNESAFWNAWAKSARLPDR